MWALINCPLSGKLRPFEIASRWGALWHTGSHNFVVPHYMLCILNLACIQLVVLAALSDEFIVATTLDDASLVKNHDAI